LDLSQPINLQVKGYYVANQIQLPLYLDYSLPKIGKRQNQQPCPRWMRKAHICGHKKTKKIKKHKVHNPKPSIYNPTIQEKQPDGSYVTVQAFPETVVKNPFAGMNIAP
jgi:hypothetical protein